MRIFRVGFAAAGLLIASAIGLAGHDRAGAAGVDRKAVAAYNASVSALKEFDFARALPDLRIAADRGVFLAQYYLARLYAMPSKPFSDRAKAFKLLTRLVADNNNIDPIIDNRAPFIARAELLLAFYYRSGLQELGIAPNPGLAKAHLERAALRLGDIDAQFELGRLDLENSETIERGLDNLDNLAVNHHHAAAAAEIAQVYSQGHYRNRVPYEALGYAMLAAKLASGSERLEIGDVYQTIYCQASAEDRFRAKELLAELEQAGRPDTDGDSQPRRVTLAHAPIDGVLDLSDVDAVRVCSNGELVPQADGAVAKPAAAGQPIRSADAAAAGSKRGFMSPIGFIVPQMGAGLKDLETPRPLSETGEPENAGDDANSAVN